MPGIVFASLAMAVPKLEALQLLGCCWDAASPAFGASCPRLSSLRIEALHVPMSALQDFGTRLPHLTTLALCYHNDQRNEETEMVFEYMNAVLSVAQCCSKLTMLDIDFSQRITLECKFLSWGLLPQSLWNLRCSCAVDPSEAFDTLIRSLPS